MTGLFAFDRFVWQGLMFGLMGYTFTLLLKFGLRASVPENDFRNLAEIELDRFLRSAASGIGVVFAATLFLNLLWVTRICSNKLTILIVGTNCYLRLCPLLLLAILSLLSQRLHDAIVGSNPPNTARMVLGRAAVAISYSIFAAWNLGFTEGLIGQQANAALPIISLAASCVGASFLFISKTDGVKVKKMDRRATLHFKKKDGS